MAERTPKLTIGMPVFNGEKFLRRAIVSLLQQTFGDFMVIISDNGSTDETANIAAELGSQDARILYIRHPENRGAIWNFNHTFRMSNSSYFKWTAADDFHSPTYLARCVEILDANPQVTWTHSVSRHVDRFGMALTPDSRFRISYHDRQTTDAVRRFESILFGSSCLDSYGVVRASALRRTPLFAPLFGSEKLLFAELALMGEYREVSEELFFSRIHESMAGALKSSKSQHQFIAASRRAPRWIRLRLLSGYASIIQRSNLATRDKVRACRALAQYVLQVRKWRRVLTGDLAGKGTGGNVRMAS